MEPKNKNNNNKQWFKNR